MFYGQFLEDKYLSQFFDSKYKGTCVDVGAYDGISGSNTYFFENNGWNCLCVEPIPESFNKCNSSRKQTINCCASNFDKDDVNFTVVDVGNNLSAISSLEIDQRLIESHKHLLQSMKTIYVKVKTLSTIFKETNFQKNIDFISIDTENTELDVIQGIDFETYNINFFIIENNFNERIIEDYLITKNFKKINRLGVNDFYVNNNYLNNTIHNIYEIINANYYNVEHEHLGNVTDIVKLLVQRYKNSQNNNIIVNNDIFTDSYPNVFKKLFISIKCKITNKIFKFIFDENTVLDFKMMFDELYNDLIKSQYYKKNYVEVSIGEIIDKYSILELKKKYISDQNKINEIQKEMDVLNDKVPNDSHFYKQLLYINEQIWLDTDVIKTLSLDNEDYNNIFLFAEISNRIFENNQKRFRLKNYFNMIENSNIKEQKSYTENNCFLNINSEEEIYNKIPEINYLCISYDLIFINEIYKITISNLFKNPNIIFIDAENQSYNINKKINIESYTIDNSLREFYEFMPITYLGTGKLGDFLNQLSVICENYYNTGRKGILYIFETAEYCDSGFTFGLEMTFNDTYNIIQNLPYIKLYKIYNNESFDINLSKWRPPNMILSHWYNIYKTIFNIDWGKHKWLNGNYDSKWSNKIIINVTPYRFLSNNAIINLKEIINNNINDIVFISNEKEHYEHFSKEININIEYYQPNNFDEIVSIVNSCKFAYLGFSSMQVIANALHKNHIIIGKFNADFILNNLKGIMSNLIDIFV